MGQEYDLNKPPNQIFAGVFTQGWYLRQLDRKVLNMGLYVLLIAAQVESRFGVIIQFSFKADFMDLAQGEQVVVDNSKRDARWRMTSVKPEAKPTGKVKLPAGEYSVFWADTHCHSNFSVDAEGEVDELVHFGRDMAGLDAMAVVDNDYYPHKALTEPEWCLYGQLARLSTRRKTESWGLLTPILTLASRVCSGGFC